MRASRLGSNWKTPVCSHDSDWVTSACYFVGCCRTKVEKDRNKRQAFRDDKSFFTWFHLDRSREPYIQDYTYQTMSAGNQYFDRYEQLCRRANNSEVYCLPVAHIKGKDLYFLLLQEVEPELNMHKYQRIGLGLKCLRYERINLPDCPNTMITLI